MSDENQKSTQVARVLRYSQNYLFTAFLNMAEWTWIGCTNFLLWTRLSWTLVLLTFCQYHTFNYISLNHCPFVVCFLVVAIISRLIGDFVVDFAVE